MSQIFKVGDVISVVDGLPGPVLGNAWRIVDVLVGNVYRLSDGVSTVDLPGESLVHKSAKTSMKTTKTPKSDYNIILHTDSYKLNHWNQYPKSTTKVYSYFESRPGAQFPYTVFFGLYPILREKLAGRVVTRTAIEEAANLCKAHFGDEKKFNRPMWERILRKHKGRLPIRIKAVKEGSVVPINNVLFTIEGTDPKCASLTNALESLLTHVWYPTTVATLSHVVKANIRAALEKSSDTLNGLDFMLHDFGYRGVSSDESGAIGGAAHLVNFKGTDTVPAILFLLEYYANKQKDGQTNPFDGIAYSVSATEHSVMTSLGRDGEVAVVKQLLQEYPTGILSVVGDSYDIYNFVENIMGDKFREDILKRDGVFVVRPDSVTPRHPTPESEVVWILQKLEEKFGATTNSKGYKVLNSHVRVLWGDGLGLDGIAKILVAMMEAGFSGENIATFGMGGGLLQKVNRDTQRFAFKSSWQERDGSGYDIWKEPLDVTKASKRGRLKLVFDENGKYITVSESDPRQDLLETVFLNGRVMRTQTLDEVRANALIY